MAVPRLDASRPDQGATGLAGASCAGQANMRAKIGIVSAAKHLKSALQSFVFTDIIKNQTSRVATADRRLIYPPITARAYPSRPPKPQTGLGFQWAGPAHHPLFSNQRGPQ